MQIVRPSPHPNRSLARAGVALAAGLAVGFLLWMRELARVSWRCWICVGGPASDIRWSRIVAGGTAAMLFASFLLANRQTRVRGSSHDLVLGGAPRSLEMLGRDGLPRVATGRALRHELRGRSLREQGRMVLAAFDARVADDPATARLVGGLARGLLQPVRWCAAFAVLAALFIAPIAWSDPTPATATPVAILALLGVVTLVLRHQLKRAHKLNADVADPR